MCVFLKRTFTSVSHVVGEAVIEPPPFISPLRPRSLLHFFALFDVGSL